MPLNRGTSDKTRTTNALEMIASGHPRDVSWAAAYREQRDARAKAGHRRKKMPESASHAPGHEISGEGGAVRQRHRMGEGGSPMGGNFGVMPFHEANKTGGMHHGSVAEHDGITLHDKHRAGPPAIDNGEGMMRSTAHSDHGPHMHHKRHHEHAPTGTRPHHIHGHHKK